VSSPTFLPLDDVVYGEAVQVAPDVRRVIAENPSKFTYRGTGTYIIGSGDVVVIDPGPRLDSHRDALAAALKGERVRAILITHCHADHSPLSEWLKAETGAPTFAVGPHETVDEPEGMFEGEEELAVPPDPSEEKEEDVVDGKGLTMRAVTTPGHTANHCCFSLEESSSLFTGDHIMGWSTTVVSPPDGSMTAYIESLHKVADRADATLWPTHGPPRTDGAEYSRALVEHRLQREQQVLSFIDNHGPSTVPEMVRVLYADVNPHLHRPAARSVLSHLIKLVDEGQVHVADGGAIRMAAAFAR
jgi:glyoxylase-like metal-dependent hydrolase (beta-lactamase superfamily II)